MEERPDKHREQLLYLAISTSISMSDTSISRLDKTVGGVLASRFFADRLCLYALTFRRAIKAGKRCYTECKHSAGVVEIYLIY